LLGAHSQFAGDIGDESPALMRANRAEVQRAACVEPDDGMNSLRVDSPNGGLNGRKQLPVKASVVHVPPFQDVRVLGRPQPVTLSPNERIGNGGRRGARGKKTPVRSHSNAV
jgi:hypothetical protein